MSNAESAPIEVETEELVKFTKDNADDIRKHMVSKELSKINCKKCNATGVYGYSKGKPIVCSCVYKVYKSLNPVIEPVIEAKI